MMQLIVRLVTVFIKSAADYVDSAQVHSFYHSWVKLRPLPSLSYDLILTSDYSHLVNIDCILFHVTKLLNFSNNKTICYIKFFR
jgi:hypothetical protein